MDDPKKSKRNNNSSGNMLSDDYMYIAPMLPKRNGSLGEGLLSADPDKQLYYSEPLPVVPMAMNPCYGGAASNASAAHLTTEEPLYETADAVCRDEK